MKKLLIGTACVLASGSLLAGGMPTRQPMPYSPHGWYAGVGINHDVVNSYTPSKYVAGTSDGVKLDSSKAGVNVFVGQRLSQHFGHELAFNDIGNQTYKVTPYNTGVTSKQSTSSNWLVAYDAYGYLPLYQGDFQSFELFAKGGVDKVYLRGANPDSTSFYKQGKFTSFGGNFGGGMQYNYQQFAARASYTNYDEFLPTNNRNQFIQPNLLALDFLYHFG